ncbi:MAG: hypothetical protein ABFR53_11780, partial [Actinomycetota bacterium]
MTRRKITHTRKHNGRLIAIGNPEEWWSPRATVDVIIDIDASIHRYYVNDRNGRMVYAAVVDSPTGPRLEASSP